MLQQTQVERVIEKYPLFIRRFPTVTSLAKAPLSAILKAWQGMGYNRRAVHLKRTAVDIVKLHKAKIPSNQEQLDDLPGIGAATASSIRAFAYNEPCVFIETNIRSVFIHHFFPGKKKISDRALLPFIRQALDTDNPRRWYSALMDYGVYLKKEYSNPGRRSVHHKPQKSFKGSSRQVRGKIIRLLTERGRIRIGKLGFLCGCDRFKIGTLLKSLEKEGLVRLKNETASI